MLSYLPRQKYVPGEIFELIFEIEIIPIASRLIELKKDFLISALKRTNRGEVEGDENRERICPTRKGDEKICPCFQSMVKCYY